MLAPTHSVFGIFMTLILLAFFGVEWSLHWTIILFAVIGSIIPDIDHPKSVIGRIFYPISSFLEERFGHRTITHSFIGWAIATVIFSLLVLFVFGVLSLAFHLDFGVWILNLAPRWMASFSISYFSHLVLDMFNKRGSQMLWPDTGRDVIPRNAMYRTQSGDKVEIFIFIILFFYKFYKLPFYLKICCNLFVISYF